MNIPPANDIDGKTNEFARFGQFIAWTTLVAFGFGGVEVLAFAVFGDHRIGAAGAVTLGYGSCLLVAREQMRRGWIKAAVITSCTGLLVGIVLVAAVLPIAIPALTILPLVVVALALPYVQGQAMRLLILASWGVGIFVAALSEALAPQSGIPTWFSTAFRIGSIVVALGLAFLMMWQFTSRLNDTLAQTRAINTELQNEVINRKRAEEELRKAHDELELKVRDRTASLSEANALLQTLLDYVPDQIYFKDAESRFIKNSRSQAVALGLSDPSQVVGKTDFDFFPHAQRSYAEEQEIIQSGKPLVDLEERVVWPDSRETWVSTTKVPLRDQEGHIIGTFGISRDITERKRAEQAIRQLNADLEAQAIHLKVANKELEAFSYSVSHDLRAPLRAIDGYTRILVEDYESNLDAEGKRVCGVISREAQRMGELIDDLLAFSRLGRKEMHTTRIDMNALANSVLSELMTKDNEERIDFRVGQLPSAAGDPVLIRQVWANLFSNAIKFTSRKKRAVIEVESKQSRDEFVYYVRDNGAGFDREYSNKLFGVFQRLHSERDFDGTGVGLAIVQRVIHRHGGRVWAEGEVDKGATFYFTLPKKENKHDRSE